jgi:hypothetical protein
VDVVAACGEELGEEEHADDVANLLSCCCGHLGASAKTCEQRVKVMVPDVKLMVVMEL